MRSWFTAVIGGRSSRSNSGPGSGTQMTPEVCRIMNATCSAVALPAAKMRSPSFSLSSSSTTTTLRPAAISAIASATGSSRTPPVTGSVGS